MVSAAVALGGRHGVPAVGHRRAARPLCGMGICFECRVTIDGRAHVRSCQVPAAPGWRSAPMDSYDVVVIGAGPADWRRRGAPECGKRVAIVDDNPAPGGQIWRGTIAVPCRRRR